MKKKIALFLALASISLSSSTAYADGELTVEQKQTIIFDGKDSGYFLAKLTNTGDAPISLDNATLALFSENDELLVSENYIDTFPSNLLIQPNESTYISEFLWNSSLENSTVGDIKFSLQTESDGKTITRIPCEATLKLKDDGEYYSYIYITFTNDSDETKYQYCVSASLQDQNGNICFINNECLNTLGVAPNSTVTFKMYIDYDFIEYFESHQIFPAVFDASVFLVNN